MATTQETHIRQRATLLDWLHGQGWFNAIRALHFAEEYHCGFRKDGITPEFSHQVHIALYLTTLAPYFRHGEEVIATALLHDVCEDYDVTFEEIGASFGLIVRKSVTAMTKDYQGERLPAEHVTQLQADDEIASISKGADRIHNQSTAIGVFSASKIEEYVEETRSYILPMLKAARKNFPHQSGAYQNIKTVLTSQVAALEALTVQERIAHENPGSSTDGHRLVASSRR